MRYALISPAWTFDGSIYFGCREPHLPLELGYASALLEREDHETLTIDMALEGFDADAVAEVLADYRPDITVVPTAPSYLFWRCPPPELRVPQQLLFRLRGHCGRIVAVGPHGSTTPATTLRKLGADAVVLGECEEVLPRLASRRWDGVDGLAWRDGDSIRRQGTPRMADLAALPALRWPPHLLRTHRHHHHRFDDDGDRGAGAELESSRGCPYHCSFCAKQDHRDGYRRRPLDRTLEELDALIDAGVSYVYFIDEIFLPDRNLLEALRARPVRFGVQTRIDLWQDEMIDLLGAAGCVTVEAGVESITPEGRERMAKRCRLPTAELTRRLVRARRGIPFVQASLIHCEDDDRDSVREWREALRAEGVWANDPVPMFPYPGSPDYARLWGAPDDRAWERSVSWYLERFAALSDIQETLPMPLERLECPPEVR